MAFVLGAPVERMTVLLSVDADFVATLVNSDGNWPVGTVIELRFHGGPTWSATISDGNATFNVDRVDVAPVIAARLQRASLYHVLSGQETLWASGPVQAVD